jgi:hypothetical protein
VFSAHFPKNLYLFWHESKGEAGSRCGLITGPFPHLLALEAGTMKAGLNGTPLDSEKTKGIALK